MMPVLIVSERKMASATGIAPATEAFLVCRIACETGVPQPITWA